MNKIFSESIWIDLIWFVCIFCMFFSSCCCVCVCVCVCVYIDKDEWMNNKILVYTTVPRAIIYFAKLTLKEFHFVITLSLFSIFFCCSCCVCWCYWRGGINLLVYCIVLQCVILLLTNVNLKRSTVAREIVFHSLHQQPSFSLLLFSSPLRSKIFYVLFHSDPYIVLRKYFIN